MSHDPYKHAPKRKVRDPWVDSRVHALAQALGRSTRSLQRDLRGAGLSHTALLALARSRAAGAWLLHTDTAVAEVGFLCGYADQAHFTRDFRHRVGLPPAAFRAAFAGAR